MRHAEPLLFVHDEQAQVSERDVGREQTVRADQHVDRAGSDVLQDLLRLSRGAEARHHLDASRERRESLAERLVVLRGQHRRRCQDGHLLALGHGLERRSHGDLGLAEADVADEQAVHRLRRLHVALDLLHRALLVRREVVREGGLELGLPRGVRSERVSSRRPAAGVELEQLLGHRLDGAAHARLDPLPARAA